MQIEGACICTVFEKEIFDKVISDRNNTEVIIIFNTLPTLIRNSVTFVTNRVFA